MARSRTDKFLFIAACAVVVILLVASRLYKNTGQPAQSDRPAFPSAPASCGRERILLDDGIAFAFKENLVKTADLMYDNPQLYAHPTPALVAKLRSWGAIPLMNGTRFCVLQSTADRAEYIYVLSGDKAGAYLWIAQSTASAEN
jgi:hypothetical protein